MTKLIRGGAVVNHDHSLRADGLVRDGAIAAIVMLGHQAKRLGPEVIC